MHVFLLQINCIIKDISIVKKKKKKGQPFVSEKKKKGHHHRRPGEKKEGRPPRVGKILVYKRSTKSYL